MQQICELNIDVACVSEPASAPRSPRWIVSGNGLAAIYLGSRPLVEKCVAYKLGRNYVMARYNQYYFLPIYISPNDSDQVVHETLDDLDADIRASGGGCVITEDFNAKSVLWGSPRTNWRGSVVERWAAGLDLRIVNTGCVPTCVRHNGTSIIDLTWSSASICGMFSGWRILPDVVSLSDHRYIVFDFGEPLGGHTGRRARYPRWNAKTLDRDLFGEIVGWYCDSRVYTPLLEIPGILTQGYTNR